MDQGVLFAPAELSGSGNLARLTVLREHVLICRDCRLCAGRTQPVFGAGNAARPPIVFVGEAPGHDEDVQGVPFVGRSGQLLEKMIQAIGYQRDEIYICNVVKCRPPDNRRPEADEVKACRKFLDGQLAAISPRSIVTLGATATAALLDVPEGKSLHITKVRGTWLEYKGIPLMPTFHPAYLLRTPEAKREVWNDLKQVKAKVSRGS